MREIKFRGKSLSGKWVYGDLVHFTNTQGVDASVIITGHQATAESDDFDYALCYARNEFKIVIPDTVGQFTGLHDKSGMEIYEGDIVTIAGVIKGYVRYNTRYWRYEIATADEPLENERIPSGRPDECWMVIGNIHDNPELLKTE